MGVFAYDPFDRSALLVCDSCERYLKADDALSEGSRAQADPEELAVHFRYRDELAAPATRAGWAASITTTSTQARWLCPVCAKRG